METRPEENHSCGAVILAAGSSSRLGRPKQLVRYHGELLLMRTVRLTQEAGYSPVVIVLGFEAARIQTEVENAFAGSEIHVVINGAWPTGMASSMRAGVAAWSELAPVDSSVLLLVCDQPNVEVVHLRQLLAIHRSQGRDITAAAYAGRLGVPAVFRRKLLDELLAVTGDQGARAVIERHHAEVATLRMPVAELDVDTPEDLRRLGTV